MTGENTDGMWLDPLGALGHKLIHAYNGDGSGPFFVVGHPEMPQTEKRLVRACFYYAIVMTPKLTAVYDNDDRGGMCSMTTDEISAIWRTEDLLAPLGLRFEDFTEGREFVIEGEIATPAWTIADEFTKGSPSDAVPEEAISDSAGTRP